MNPGHGLNPNTFDTLTGTTLTKLFVMAPDDVYRDIVFYYFDGEFKTSDPVAKISPRRQKILRTAADSQESVKRAAESRHPSLFN